MKNYIMTIIIVFCTSSLLAVEQGEPELKWPREINVKTDLITLYQPQLESFRGDTLEGRMAISIKPEEDDMIFCAIWFTAKMITDKEARIVYLDKIQIPQVHFPDMDDQKKIDEFSALLIKEVESWNLEMSLDRLLASMNDVEGIKNLSVQLKNDPPDIYFRTVPTSLISLDGDPIIKEIENSELEYVVNTPFFIVREKGKSNYYIKGGKFWYQSNHSSGLWSSRAVANPAWRHLGEQT